MQPLHIIRIEDVVPEFAKLVDGYGVARVGTTPTDTIALFVEDMDAMMARDLATQVKTEWEARHVNVFRDGQPGGDLIWSTSWPAWLHPS